MTNKNSAASETILSPGKTMFIIGNSNVTQDLTTKIDQSDHVVRFNKLNNYNNGTGNKITNWVLSSNKFLINQQITGAVGIGNNSNMTVKDIVHVPELLLFAIPPSLPARTSSQTKVWQRLLWEDKKERMEAVCSFMNHFEVEDKHHRIIEFPKKYVADLVPEIWSPNWTCPSNGYLITRMLVEDPTFYKYKKYLVGFSWEGWDGHPWMLEKLYLEKLERDDLITIIR